MRLLSFTRWAASTGLALLMAMTVSGCSCDTGQPLVYYDDFEGGGEGGTLPQRWHLVTGGATWISTYHAGEHGIHLTQEGTIASNPSEVFLNPQAYDVVFLNASCIDASLFLDLVVVGDDGEPLTLRGELQPGDNRQMPSYECQLTPVRTAANQSAPIRSITIGLIGSGSCVVDELRIASGEEAECY
jgi:hypothetical protein